MRRLIVAVLFCLVFFGWVRPVLAASTYDVGTTSNWNLRFDGAAATEALAGQGYSIAVADLNNNGRVDLIVKAQGADNNSRSDSGSVYIIYDSLFSSLTATANTIDLSNAANYSVRFDGAAASDGLGSSIAVGDFNADGTKDLLMCAALADNNARSNSGSCWLVFNTLLSTLSGNVDLATSTNYNIRYDGAAANDQMGSKGTWAADLNSNGYADIAIPAWLADFNGRGGSGSVYLIYNSLVSAYTTTGNNVDLGTLANYSVRLDGATGGDALGGEQITSADTTGTGSQDLFVTAPFATSAKGWVYLIYNSVLTGLSGNVDLSSTANYSYRFQGATDDVLGNGAIAMGDLNNDGKADLIIAGRQVGSTGPQVYIVYSSSLSGLAQNVDFATSSNYNLRITGPANTNFASTEMMVTSDLDNDGRTDLLVGAWFDDNNSRTNSGSAYVFYNSVLLYSGTGNTVDYSGIYSVRYDGAVASDLLGVSDAIGDLNRDGSNDVLVGASSAGNNSRAGSGSLYVVYNFPHTLSLAHIGKDFISGTVSAPNSATAVSGVQYNYNSNSPTASTWRGCTGTTSFTCTLTDFPSGTKNTVYIRAYDSNTSYTIQANYGVAVLNDGTSSSTTTSSTPTGYQYPITIGPNLVGTAPTQITSGTSPADTVTALFSSTVVDSNDLYVQIMQVSPWYLGVPPPWTQGYNTASEISLVNFLSAFNGYPFYTTLNPYTLIMSYDPARLYGRSPNELLIAYWDRTSRIWKTFPKCLTVLNTYKHTLAVATRVASTYFAVVYPSGYYSIYTPGPVLSPASEPTIQPDPAPVPESVPPPLEQPKTCFLWWCW